MPQLFGIGTSVFVQNGSGEILILKRAGGAEGAWYVPGGKLGEGETPEESARSDLKHVTGLEIPGPMHLVAVTPMVAYDQDIFLLAYAGDFVSGDVTLSPEHEEYRWLSPQGYRDKYFSDENIKVFEQQSEVAAEMTKSVRTELDAYLDWVMHRGGN